MPEISELQIEVKIKDPVPQHPMVKWFTVIYTLKFCNTSHRLGFLQKDGEMFLVPASVLKLFGKGEDGFNLLSDLDKGQTSNGLLHEINSTAYNLKNILSEEIDVYEITKSNAYCEAKEFPIITLRIEGRVITEPKPSAFRPIK